MFFLLVLAAGGWWWYAKNYAPPEAPKVLGTTVMEKGVVREVIEATGIIKPQVGAEIEIGAQATGRIQRMLVRVGDLVNKGDLIAVIDDRELLAQREKALADLGKAHTSLDFARRRHSRQRRLFRQGVVSQDTLDETAEQVRAAEDEVASLEASVRVLDVKLTYTEIRSPISGVVSQVAAEEGETVVSGLEVTNLVTVLDSTRLEMWAYMDETDIGQVRPGQPVEFQIDALPDEIFESRVESIYPKPEIRDNIVYYLALAPVSKGQARKLRPEMTTQCRVVVEEKAGVLALPNTALKWVNGEMAVFVVEKVVGKPGGEKPEVRSPLRWDFWKRPATRTGGTRVRKVIPELGLRGITHSEVVSGLREGDVVATQIVLPSEGKGGKARSGERR